MSASTPWFGMALSIVLGVSLIPWILSLLREQNFWGVIFVSFGAIVAVSLVIYGWYKLTSKGGN